MPLQWAYCKQKNSRGEGCDGSPARIPRQSRLP